MVEQTTSYYVVFHCSALRTSTFLVHNNKIIMPPRPKQRNNSNHPNKYNAYGPNKGGNNTNNNRYHNNNNRKRQRRQPLENQEDGTTVKRIVSNNKAKAITPTCSVCNIIENPKYKCPKCRFTYCSINCCKVHKETLCCIVNNKHPTEDKGQNENVISQDEVSSIIETNISATSMKSKYISQTDLIQLISDMKQQQCIVKGENDDSDSDDDSDDDDGWQMNIEMIDSMKQSLWLKNELKNDIGLRNLLESIINKSNRIPKQQHQFDRKRKRNTSSTCNMNNTNIILETEQEMTLYNYKQRYPQFQQFIDKLLVITNILERQQSHQNGSSNMTTSLSLTEWLNQNNTNNNESSEYLILKPIERKRRINNPNAIKKLITELDDDDDHNVESQSLLQIKQEDNEKINNNNTKEEDMVDKSSNNDDDTSDNDDDSTTTSSNETTSSSDDS